MSADPARPSAETRPIASDHPATDPQTASASDPTSAAPASTSVVVVAPKIRQPLNPAYAILFGAVVTASSGITAAVLSIRSSERLSNQQDKTSAAVQANQDLQRKVDTLDRALEAADARLAALSSTTVVVSAPVALPSIVVVLPTLDPALVTTAPPVASTVVAPTTRARPVTTAPSATVPSSTVPPTVAAAVVALVHVSC